MRLRIKHEVLALPASVGQGCCQPGSDCNRPAWLVTTPRETPRADVRGPVGIVHVRRNGALTTACGRSTVTWHTFFDHEFMPSSQESCAECARVVAAVAAFGRVDAGRWAATHRGDGWQVAQ